MKEYGVYRALTLQEYILMDFIVPVHLSTIPRRIIGRIFSPHFTVLISIAVVRFLLQKRMILIFGFFGLNIIVLPVVVPMGLAI